MRYFFAWACFLYFLYRPAEQIGSGAVVGDENRGARPRQAFCGVDGIGYKLGIHAGEGLVEQQRLCITAEQRPQQRSAPFLPAGEPRCRQCQLRIGKAECAQLPLCLLLRQPTAGQH